MGLASPAAWLRRAGLEVRVQDLAIESLDEKWLRQADAVAIHLPMHTATRIALELIPRLRRIQPRARLIAYGLYAPLNAEVLSELGVGACIGGEYEAALVEAVLGGSPGNLPGSRQPSASAADSRPASRPRQDGASAIIPLDALDFIRPDRAGLPSLDRYARLEVGDGESRRVGYTEASRGCKHHCRHCPVVPVYEGRFRVIPVSVVLEDIAQQVAAGAEHITFGDPDFLNGPTHALRVARALHRRFPTLGWDATIKVEHLVRHADLLPELRAAGCILITSAVEAIDEAALAAFDKGHDRQDFARAAALCRRAGIALSPTFVAFHPWLSLAGYRELLASIVELDLIDHVAPVQLSIRLLLPAGSKLMDLPEVTALAEDFDRRALVHPWRHPDPRVDRLQQAVEAEVAAAAEEGAGRRATFERIWRLATTALGRPEEPLPAVRDEILGLAGDDLQPGDSVDRRAPIPYLTEPWYC